MQDGSDLDPMGRPIEKAQLGPLIGLDNPYLKIVFYYYFEYIAIFVWILRDKFP